MSMEAEERELEIENKAAYEKFSKLLLEALEARFDKKVSFSLFHYTTAVALCSIMKNEELWFSKWNSMNDPTELQRLHEIFDIYIEEYKTHTDFYNMLKDYNSFENYVKRSDEVKWYKEYDAYVFSFTRRKNQLNMWLRYANARQDDGYSIEFNDVFDYNNTDYSINLIPVVYDRVKQETIVKELLQDLYCAYNDSTLLEKGRWDRDLIMAYLFDDAVKRICGSFKDSAYEDEDEVRAILHLSNKKLIKHRTASGRIVPYVPVKFNTSKIKSVTISPTLRYRFALPGLRALKNSLGLDFDIVQSEILFRN